MTQIDLKKKINGYDITYIVLKNGTKLYNEYGNVKSRKICKASTKGVILNEKIMTFGTYKNYWEPYSTDKIYEIGYDLIERVFNVCQTKEEFQNMVFDRTNKEIEKDVIRLEKINNILEAVNGSIKD